MAESSVGGAVVGSLKVLIGADVAGLLEGIQQSKEALGEFAAEENVTAGSLKTLALALVAVAATFAGEFVHGAMEAINSQYLLAQQLGTTVASVQTLDRAAELSGSSADKMEAAARRLTATLGQVEEKGAGPAYDALNRLGLSASDLSKMDLDKRIEAIAEKMQELGYNSAQEAAVLKDLGLRGGDLMGVFQNGGAAIEEAREQLSQFGVLLSDLDATKVHIAQESFETVGVVLKGVANTLVVQLAPYIIAVADQLEAAAAQGHGFGDAIKGGVDLFIQGVGLVQDGLRGLQIGVDSLQLLGMDVGQIIDDVILTALRDINLLISALTSLGQWAGQVIPGLAAPSQALQATMDKAVANVSVGVDSGAAAITSKMNEIKTLFTTPWPSTGIAKWSADVQTDADKAAAALKKVKDAAGTGGGDGANTGPSDADKAASKTLQDKLDSELKSLQASLGATEESENASYQTRLTELQQFLDHKMITQSQYNDLLSREQQDHANKMQKIAEAEFKEETQLQFAALTQIANIMDSIGSILQSTGEDHFGIVKGLSVATAIVKGYEAITSAYAAGAAIPGGGFITGALYAAAAAAAVGAQIASLLSVTSSSTTAPSAGGSSAPAAAAAPTASPAGTAISISGINPTDLYSGTAVRNLIKAFNSAIRDGATLVVNP